MRFFLLRLISLLLTLAFLLVGCGDNDGADQVIKYDIAGGVGNLDPQFATDETARMIISNTFEGLFRLSSDGSVVPALAQSCEVSPDGLRYTFFLRRDAFWSPDPAVKDAQPERVTARDFVFALRRLFNPAAPSPFAGSLISIANARNILEGNNSAATLGAEAVDDYTLRITLEQPEALLPALLADTYAVPCREPFFESTHGRYGLQAGMLVFNGPFRVTQWNNESSISLRRNSAYHGEVTARGVEFNIPAAIARTAEANFVADPVQRFLNGTTDACKIDAELTARVARSGGTVIAFEDTVWVLALNNDPDRAFRFSSMDIRQAVAYAVDRSLFAGELPENMRVTTTLIPPDIPSNGRSFRHVAGDVSPLAYSPDLARRSYRKGMADLQAQSLAFGQILVPDEPALRHVAGYLQRTIQQYLASPVGIESLPREELMKRVAEGDYAAAVVPLTADYASPASILSRFRSEDPENFTSFHSSEFDALLESVSGLSAQERDAAYSNAEQLLLTECPIVPLFYETSYYGAAKGVSDIGFSPFLSGMRFESARKRS